MKPILMRHIESANESFKAWTNAAPYLHNPWHYHPECEITVICEGNGVLFVGDKVVDYKKDDLIMIGPNLPHEWRSSIKMTPDYFSQSVAVHFRPDFPGEDFYKIPEANDIQRLIRQSYRGVKVYDRSTQRTVKEKLIHIQQARGIDRINMLFSILDDIANAPDPELLCSQSFIDSTNEGHDQRMIAIYKYVMTHFKEKVSVEQLAKEMHMSTTSFCRFFKKRTNKSFLQYLNTIRISYACKLLYEERYNISEIAYESGFENISNFNKQFLKMKGKTPSEVLAQFVNREKIHVLKQARTKQYSSRVKLNR